MSGRTRVASAVDLGPLTHPMPCGEMRVLVQVFAPEDSEGPKANGRHSKRNHCQLVSRQAGSLGLDLGRGL